MSPIYFVGLVQVSCARAKIIHDLLNWLFSQL